MSYWKRICRENDDLYEKQLLTYEEPLVWSFKNLADVKEVVMYGTKNECTNPNDLSDNCFVFFKKDGKYFIDVLKSYELGDSGDGYGYEFLEYCIDKTCTIEINKENELDCYKEIVNFMDQSEDFHCFAYNYIVLGEDCEITSDVDCGEVRITKGNKTIICWVHGDTVFSNENERQKCVNAFVDIIRDEWDTDIENDFHIV